MDATISLWQKLFTPFAIGMGAYAISVYLTTASGTIPIGFLTPPLAMGLQSQPVAIYIHALCAGTALITCGLQMLPAFRCWASAGTHRVLGWLYVLCVIMGACSGAALSRTAVGGRVSTAGFAALACLWLGTTLGAVYARRVGRLHLHARLMTHSAACAFAAVTLRAYLPAAILYPPFSGPYSIISWVSWVPNVLLVEAWYALASCRARQQYQREDGAGSLLHGADKEPLVAPAALAEDLWSAHMPGSASTKLRMAASSGAV